MMNSYKAAFLIPRSAKKILDETGWLFETEDRVRSEVLDVLKRVFLLEHKESYLGIVAYVGDGIKVSVIYDEAGLIEYISVQLGTRSSEELASAFCENEFNDIEIFMP